MNDTTGVSKRRLLEIVRELCSKCARDVAMRPSDCLQVHCPAYPLRLTSLQLNAFDGDYKQNWFDLMEQKAELYRDRGWFYPSELRAAMEMDPAGKNAHSSWIGSGIQRLLKRGWRKTSEHRASPRKSCNGRHEYKFAADWRS